MVIKRERKQFRLSEENATPVSVKVPDPIVRKMDDLAYQLHMSRANVVRILLEEAVDNLDILNKIGANR